VAAGVRARPQPGQEGLANLRGVELANLTSQYLADMTTAAYAGIDRIRRTPRLLYSFLHPTALRAW
jgi:hypothetical protein